SPPSPPGNAAETVLDNARTGMDTALPHRPGRAFAVVVVMLVALAACSSSSSSGKSSTSGASSTGPMRVAFLGDIGAPDPDLFYATEGLMVTTSVYEGLLQYADNSTKIVPSLAELPTISSDRLTYTFKLQAGVTFHDGTAFDSAAVKASFARRTAV